MATSAQDARTRRDLEAMIGLDPIEVLQADRRALVEEVAPLRARYGPGGTWDAQRKAHRSAVANRIATELTAERSKAPSEAELERLAAGDPDVRRLLDEVEAEMAAYWLLEVRITELTELINRDQVLIRYAANEPH